MKLIDPKKTIEVIQQNNFNFQKRFGQNFLIDAHVLDKIMDAAAIGPEDYVLEIGPGIGTMTQALAERAGHVTAVEIDDKLIPILQANLAEYDNVDIIHNDILKLDIQQLVNERNDGKPIKIVANLPYYITTPIIMGLFENHVPMISATVMVQKEVAERMAAGPGTKDYGALSLAVQYYSTPVYAATVPPNCFMPRPNVASAVVRLDRHAAPRIAVKDETLLFNLIKASFEQRRKTLVNAVSSYAKLHYTKDQITAALEACGFNPLIRGEALTLEQFGRLADELKTRGEETV